MTNDLTKFAPAERADHDEVVREWRCFDTDSPIATLLNLMPEVVLILNRQRQVVFANRAALEYSGAEELETVLGMRPGELLRCKHSQESEGGCGTTEACRYCGATHAMLESQEGRSVTEECRITTYKDGNEEALDLRAWARPLEMAGEDFTFFTLSDIADQKRRESLERIFLHDMMNTATALKGFSWMLSENGEDAESVRKYGDRISVLSERMIAEIQAHRQLLAAERGELKPNPEPLNSYVLLQDVFLDCCRPEMLARRVLRLDEQSASVDFVSDPMLMTRVLENLLKNAIEASAPGERVSMGCYELRDEVVFWVHNAGYMPEGVRLQIFNRSFSTKGPGRGLGTYSVKYLSERYLGGHVSFTSTEEDGTRFEARYPRDWRGGIPN